MYLVKKRDDRMVEFDLNKIKNAITKAFVEVDKELTSKDNDVIDKITLKINDYIESKNKVFSVEEIQDIVEKKLMKSNRQDVAKAYIIYRNERNKARESNSDIVKRTKQRMNANINERSNANVDELSFSGREKEAGVALSKTIAFDLGGVSNETAKALKEMLIYPHDSEKFLYGEHNCSNPRLDKLLRDGFSTRNGDVRGAKSLSTVFQLIAVIFQCGSQVQYGGIASAHLDIDLAPYVKKSFLKAYVINIAKQSDDFESLDIENMTDEQLEDWVEENKSKYLSCVGLKESDIYIDNKDKLDKKIYNASYFDLREEGKQGAEALYHNLNTLESRPGSQVPFTSINLGRDTSTEGRLITKWIFNSSLKGIGMFHRTSIFPISIFQRKRGVNDREGTPNYDLYRLGLKSLSKRIYPNICNCDWSQANEDPNDPDTYMSTMGCRTMLGYDVNGYGNKRVGRGNASPHTIILPKLGIEHGICLGNRKEPDLDGFWKALEDTLELCERTLLERYEIIKKQSPKSAPFLYQNATMYGAEDCKDTVEECMKHQTLAIGYIGIAEMCQALFGKNHAEDENVWLFAQKVQKRIYDFAKEATNRNSLNFSCYATPAEGLCSTALKALRKQYGIIDKVTSNEFLTNSHHVPVWTEISITDKLMIEAPFCKYATGGCITYVEVDSTFIKNEKALNKIIKFACDVLDIPYLAFNFPIDTCLNCGYQGEINKYCPECNSDKIEHLARVTGYISVDASFFNDGKREEVKLRYKHSKCNNRVVWLDKYYENIKTTIKRCK